MPVLQRRTPRGSEQVSFPPQYPYQPNQGVAITQIVRRMMTDGEKQLGIGYYKKMQNGLRGLAFVSLILFVFNGYVLASVVDPITYDALSIVLTIFMVVMGLMAIGMSINLLLIRKRITDAMRDGTAVEVTGPAYMSRAAKNMPLWTVGPVSLMSTREVMGMLQEGAPTTILCLPRLKIAVAINNYGLKQGVRITFPPNLEAMAVQAFQPATPPMVQPYQSLSVVYQPPVPQK